jgi:hypothetical protein
MTFFDDTALQYPARAEFLFFALERDKKIITTITIADYCLK